MDVIEKCQYDPKLGFTSAEKLYKRLKGDGYNIPLLTVKNWIKKQSVYQQYKYVKPIKRFFPIMSPNDKPFELLQVDLLDISNLSGSNNNVKYLLLCIDVHSRFAFVTPMTDKNSDTINISIELILKLQIVYALSVILGQNLQIKNLKLKLGMLMLETINNQEQLIRFVEQ